MHDHVTVVHHHPAVAGETLFPSFFVMAGAHIFQDGVGERVQHTVAGAAADHKIVGKGGHIFDINQDNVLPLFVFEGVDDFTCKFECVQRSPHL